MNNLMRGRFGRLAAAASVAAASLVLSATPAPAQAAPTEQAPAAASGVKIAALPYDCQVGPLSLTFTNTRGRTTFQVRCTVSHNLTVDIVGYDSQGNPLTPPLGSQTGRVPVGGWIPAWGEVAWGGVKPVAHICAWVYRDNPPTVLLRKNCR